MAGGCCGFSGEETPKTGKVFAPDFHPVKGILSWSRVGLDCLVSAGLWRQLFSGRNPVFWKEMGEDPTSQWRWRWKGVRLTDNMFTIILRTAACCCSPLLAFQQVKKPFLGKTKPKLEPFVPHSTTLNANQQPQYTQYPQNSIMGKLF